MKTKQFSIELPDELYQEVIDNAATAFGFKAKTTVRTEDGRIANIDEKRSKEQFVKDYFKAQLINGYQKGVKLEASRQAQQQVSEQIKEKLNTLK